VQAGQVESTFKNGQRLFLAAGIYAKVIAALDAVAHDEIQAPAVVKAPGVARPFHLSPTGRAGIRNLETPGFIGGQHAGCRRYWLGYPADLARPFHRLLQE